MQFDTVHIYGGASLADPYWVTGATLWGALLAKLALRLIRWDGARRLGPVAILILALLAGPSGTHFIANFLQIWMANASNSYSWGPFWVSVPIGAVIVAFRLAQPSIDRHLSLARALASLNCAHAAWALMSFPADLFRYIEPETRPGFERIVLAVPAVAISGLLALLAVQISVGNNGRAKGWSEWFSARLQLAIAVLVLLVQIHILDVAAFPSFERPFPIASFAAAASFVMGVMAVLRLSAQRKAIVATPVGARP